MQSKSLSQSQTKFLLMKLWDYFEQKARKPKVNINVKKRILKSIGIHSLVFSHLTDQIIYCKSDDGMGEFSTPRKRYYAACRNLLISQHLQRHS